MHMIGVVEQSITIYKHRNEIKWCVHKKLDSIKIWIKKICSHQVVHSHIFNQLMLILHQPQYYSFATIEFFKI